MKDLRGKNALLTGASRGLGPFIGRALARRGVNVALTARAADALQSVAHELTGLGVRTTAVPGDVNDAADRQRVVGQTRGELGSIDILINNAGMEWLSRYVSLSAEHIERMVQTNLVAPLLLSRLVLPEMLARGSGHIVMMSSLGGKKGSPYTATYASTKAGLIEWTSGIREELRGTGVSASVVCPGFVSAAGMFAAYGKRAPRLAGESTPQRVAAAVLRAIEGDVGEIIVNPGPVRLMLVANAIHPGILRWVFSRFGLYDFYRRQADENERRGASQNPESTVRPGAERR